VERLHFPDAPWPPERYAIKIMNKQRLHELSELRRAKIERAALTFADFCPFIVQMKFTFQTKFKLYIGLEYAPGGALLTYLTSLFVIPLCDAWLYIALYCSILRS
jgi:serine/threonine protein kinase